MIKVEEWTTIRLLKEKGYSIRRIALTLHISRNTVRKAIRKGSFREYSYGNHKKSKSRVAKYHNEIIEMILNKKFIGSRIIEELKKKGYSGSPTAYYDYVRKIKCSINLSKISERYETESGEMAQFDWSPYMVNIAGNERRVIIFNTILCFSRYRKYFMSVSEKQWSVFEALEDAFEYFKGVPSELLVDNAKSMVEKRTKVSTQWNKKFAEFMGYYKIQPKACKVRKPRTKGKVENPFYYLEQHFIKGSKFRSLEEMQDRLLEFTEKVNKRHHQGINEIPEVKYLAEIGELRSLPDKCFVGMNEEHRQANFDCLISVNGNKYSVPYTYAGQRVFIRISQGYRLKIFSQSGKLIASHKLAEGKNQMIINQKHYEGLRRRKIRDKDLMIKRFEEAFPNNLLFLNKIISSKHINVNHHLYNILDLLKYYSKLEVEKAIREAMRLNVYASDVVIGILRVNTDIEMKNISLLTISKDVPNVDIRPDMSAYTLTVES